MLYCILNPKGLRYATLRRLPDSEIFALALFQQPCSIKIRPPLSYRRCAPSGPRGPHIIRQDARNAGYGWCLPRADNEHKDRPDNAEGRSECMRIVVDLNRCQTYGQCVFAAPTVFELRSEEILEYEYAPDDSLRAQGSGGDRWRFFGRAARRRGAARGGICREPHPDWGRTLRAVRQAAPFQEGLGRTDAGRARDPATDAQRGGGMAARGRGNRAGHRRAPRAARRWPAGRLRQAADHHRHPRQAVAERARGGARRGVRPTWPR